MSATHTISGQEGLTIRQLVTDATEGHNTTTLGCDVDNCEMCMTIAAGQSLAERLEKEAE